MSATKHRTTNPAARDLLQIAMALLFADQHDKALVAYNAAKAIDPNLPEMDA